MSILRPRLAFALAAIVLASAAAGCSKHSAAETDDGDEPAADEGPSTGADKREVARRLGLTPDQEAQYADFERGEHRHGGRHHGARIERRVERITRALGLTPEQSEKLRLILREEAARAGRRHRMQPGAEDPRFPQGGEPPQGGRRFRRGGDFPPGGGGFPQGGPGFPQRGRGFPQGGRGFPRSGPDDPQGPQGPQAPEGPDGPQGGGDRFDPADI